MAIDFRNQRTQLMLMGIALPLIALVLFYMYVWSPKSEELATVQTRLTALDSLNKAARADVAKGNVAKLKAQNEAMRGQLAVMRQLVPTGQEVPLLLDQISTAARRVGLELADVTPQAVATGEQFDVYRYRMRLSGDYQTIGQFLTNVGSLTRIVVPINVTLAMGTRPSREKSKALLDASFEVQTFVSHTSGPQALTTAAETPVVPAGAPR